MKIPKIYIENCKASIVPEWVVQYAFDHFLANDDGDYFYDNI